MVSSTIHQVDLALRNINSHPEYSSAITKELNSQLRTEAESHSLEIELRGEGFKFKNHLSLTNNNFRRLKEAWNYLTTFGVDVHSLSRLGPIIEPKDNSSNGFRQSEVQFGGFAPPGPQEIPFRVEHLAASLEDRTTHPIVLASHAHVEMVGIHPFVDGNGRAARLLQDFFLCAKGYPVAIIPATERNAYIGLMKRTLLDRYAGKSHYTNPSSAESDFIEFVGSKVLSSVNFLQHELQSRRMYSVDLTRLTSPSVVHSVAGVLRGFSKRPGNRGVTVKVKKRIHACKGESLDILGDLSPKELKTSLTQLADQYRFAYELHFGNGVE